MICVAGPGLEQLQEDEGPRVPGDKRGTGEEREGKGELACSWIRAVGVPEWRGGEL